MDGEEGDLGGDGCERWERMMDRGNDVVRCGGEWRASIDRWTDRAIGPVGESVGADKRAVERRGRGMRFERDAGKRVSAGCGSRR